MQSTPPTPWQVVYPAAAIAEQTPNLTTDEIDRLELCGFFGYDLMVVRDEILKRFRCIPHNPGPITDLLIRLQASPAVALDEFIKIYKIKPVDNFTAADRLFSSLEWCQHVKR